MNMPVLKKIVIRDFRNIELQEIEFSPFDLPEAAETTETFEFLDAEECVSDVGMQMDFAESSEDMESGETAEAEQLKIKIDAHEGEGA
mgnify:CR=1 FL=1